MQPDLCLYRHILFLSLGCITQHNTEDPIVNVKIATNLNPIMPLVKICCKSNTLQRTKIFKFTVKLVTPQLMTGFGLHHD